VVGDKAKLEPLIKELNLGEMGQIEVE